MNRTTMFVASVIGLAVSAAVLILLLPSLFDSGDGPNTWLISSLAILAVIFAVGTGRLRPSAQPGAH